MTRDGSANDAPKSPTEVAGTWIPLQQLTEHIDDVLYLRRAGELAYVSPAWANIWGRQRGPDQTRGEAWMSAVPAEDRPRLARAWTRLEHGRALDETYRVVQPDGEVRTVHERAWPTATQGLSVGVARDVTQELAVQEELRRAHRMEAVGTLASGITHDFNNLLMGVIGCLRQAQRWDVSQEERSTYLERAEEAVLRGTHLVSRLQVFGRPELPDPEPVEIDEAVEVSATLLRVVLGEDHQLVLRTGAPGTFVGASEVELDQILLNLTANARDAMTTGGRVIISTDVILLEDLDSEPGDTAESSRFLRLEFRDTGCGMGKRTRQRLFEPFFTTKEVGRGTGLGLSTVFAITQRLGGTIDLRSEVGVGTTFELLLPCVEAPAVPSPPTHDPVPTLSGTVLLVEDEPLVRLVVTHYLEEFGLQVFGAATPAEATAYMEQHGERIDMLISDVILPDLTGPSLARTLREVHSDLRVLFMSAHPRAELVRRRILEGPDALIEKPFSQEALGRALVPILGTTRD